MKPRGKPFKKGHPQYFFKHTEESKKKISLKNKGKPASAGSFKKGHKRVGNSGAKKGIKHSEEWKRKQGEGIKRFYDRKGRKEHKRYIHFGNSSEYRQWRSDVFQRDNWTCQTCRIRGNTLVAHHIKSWAKFPELRYEIFNGITLCENCHKLTDNYKGNNK